MFGVYLGEHPLVVIADPSRYAVFQRARLRERMLKWIETHNPMDVGI
jgi:hypothetical protein